MVQDSCANACGLRTHLRVPSGSTSASEDDRGVELASSKCRIGGKDDWERYKMRNFLKQEPCYVSTDASPWTPLYSEQSGLYDDRMPWEQSAPLYPADTYLNSACNEVFQDYASYGYAFHQDGESIAADIFSQECFGELPAAEAEEAPKAKAKKKGRHSRRNLWGTSAPAEATPSVECDACEASGPTSESSGADAGAKPMVQSVPEEERTTLMVRNIPNEYTRDTFLHLLNTEGFKESYDFIYMPVDFQSDSNFGYAFVNCVSHDEAERVQTHFQCFTEWNVNSRKVCDVAWSGPHQGLAAHVERYRSSPVMHEDVPDKYKPVVFTAGVRVEFLPPSKRIRKPRVRHAHHNHVQNDVKHLDSTWTA